MGKVIAGSGEGRVPGMPTEDRSFKHYLRESIAVLEQSFADLDHAAIDDAVDIITSAVSADRPLLICGNGGSAADAMHIAGELVGRFLCERRALNAISLASNPAILSCLGNDYGFETIFARQVEACGAPGGVLLGISTSGRSPNVVNAAKAARQMNMKVISLTGMGGGDLKELSDVLLAVPSRSTPLIQQVHMVVYHYLCEAVERRCLPAVPETVGEPEMGGSRL